MFLTNSSIQWFYISWYLAKLWFSCQVMPWDGPNAKDKCSLAFEIIDLTTLNLGLFSVIRLSSKCDAAYCGLKIFLSGYETAISPQKYTSKSHWPHKSILHMMSQCSIIIWVITLVKKCLLLKGTPLQGTPQMSLVLEVILALTAPPHLPPFPSMTSRLWRNSTFRFSTFKNSTF